jgi:hypothetical protein
MSRPLRIFLAGEGTNDIGSYAGDQGYWDPQQAGFVGAVIRKVAAILGTTNWEIVGGIPWKKLHRLRGKASRSEASAVGAAAFRARDKQHDADLLVFVRDTDGDKNRAAEIREGIAVAVGLFGTARPHEPVVAGIVDPVIEAWALALCGERGCERASKGSVQTRALKAGVGDKSTLALEKVVESADLDAIPGDAADLQEWLAALRAVLASRI